MNNMKYELFLNEYRYFSHSNQGLNKVFKTDAGEVNVLEDIDLDIMKGEIFGISV